MSNILGFKHASISFDAKFWSFYLIREKKLLTSSEDYGKDLTGVQNLRKKHQRLEAELNTHEARIQVGRRRYLILTSAWLQIFHPV